MAYYLFRLLNPSIPHFEVTKWDDGKMPVDRYSVFPRTHSCNCVAVKRECKHVMCCIDLDDPAFSNEIELWGWDESRGWFETHDIMTKEEFIAAAG